MNALMNIAPNTNGITYIDGVPMMSHLEIALVLGHDRPDNIKRAIERLTDQGVITFTPTEGKSTGGRPGKTYWVTQRDSYVVVAQLCPEFTARIVDRWMELEAKTPRLPQTYAEALEHLLVSVKENERIQLENEHLNKTKHLISEKSRATAMQRAGVEARMRRKAERRVAELEDELGEGRNWKAARAIPWLKEFFDIKSKKCQGTWVAIGHALRNLSMSMDYEIRSMEDAAYKKVNKYHVDVIDAFYELLSTNPRVLAEYRRDI